ncbi:hypothetical protein C9I98_09405 [Photobacterium sanctipauli]|uniref:Penicillin-binding protein activator LpoB n=1 Tax=Photobacterium sanctipauli TaxID=1342794 RepID=A0A2T3NVF5_9GAMM|nr:hypothetical protein [Photobacterium sanctipauli]PSW20260.1 hypothetical protein C9I98_09405 [Photobacterium sanctipauli]
MKRIFTLTAALALSACSSYQVPESPSFAADSNWAVMPMTNNSSTPLAAEKAEQILNAQLYAKGINAKMYPASITHDLKSILDNSAKQQQAQAWLATQPVDFVITGSVEEWHYKSGLDGEPAVGITLEVKSAKSGTTYWRATGTRGGWGRESVSGTGHIVIDELLDGLNIAPAQQ